MDEMTALLTRVRAAAPTLATLPSAEKDRVLLRITASVVR